MQICVRFIFTSRKTVDGFLVFCTVRKLQGLSKKRLSRYINKTEFPTRNRCPEVDGRIENRERKVTDGQKEKILRNKKHAS